MKKAAMLALLLGIAVWLWKYGVDNDHASGEVAAIRPPASIAGVPNTARTFFSDERAQPVSLPPSRGQKIDALVARGRPEDALAAFQIAAQCKAVHDWERGFMDMAPPGESADIACAGITQGHLMDMPRLLQIALKARAKGAVLAQFRFGPLDGDVWALQTRPGDPAVVAWQTSTRLALIEEARRTGTEEVLADLSYTYLTGELGEKNPELYLAYFSAYLERRDRRGGIRSPHSASMIAEASRGLTQEQIDAAADFTKKLLEECCPNPKGK